MLAANQAPINSVPGSQETIVDVPLAFTAYRENLVSISDADAGENAVRVSLSVDQGTLTLLYPDPSGGITYLSGDGTEDASMSFVGTIDTINSALRWISYRPAAGFTGAATFTIETNDLGMVGTGGAKSDTDTVTITVNPVPAFAPSPTYETLPGVLDSSFGGSGKVVLSLTDGGDYIHDMQVLPDGKIFAVGALNNRFGLMRFNADMTLDESFGTNGITISDFGAGRHAASFVFDSSGRIVVVGSNRVARYSADGAVDATFGTNGSVVIDYVGQAYDVEIQADGRIVITGRDDSSFRLMRLSLSGDATEQWAYNPRWDWGVERDYARGILSRDDGRIVLVGTGGDTGHNYNNPQQRFSVVVTNQAGNQQQQYNYDIGQGESVSSILPLPDGRFMVVGSVGGNLALTRHLFGGEIDPTFGVNGKVSLPVLNAHDQGYRATLAADGKILIAGFAGNGLNTDLFIVRMSYDGELDTSFGFGGKVSTNFGGANDYGFAIAALPDGKILAAGRRDNDIAMVRLLGDFDLNSAPEDIALSATSVDEDKPVGTVVGTLTTSDPDEEPSYTYALVAGAGDADNAAFEIAGNELKTKVALDYETKASYSIRIQTEDGGGKTFQKAFTITVNDVAEGIADVALSATSIDEGNAVGAVVGTLSTSGGAGNLTYTLVAGSGDTDNATFEIVGDELKAKAVFDFETKSSYSVRIEAKDGSNQTLEKAFTIDVVDVNEAPADLTLKNAEDGLSETTDTTSRQKIADISFTDDAIGQTVVSLSGADAAVFEVDSNALYLKAGTPLDFDVQRFYSVTVEVKDDTIAGSATLSASHTLNIIAADEIVLEVAEGETLVEPATYSGGTKLVKLGKGTLILDKVNSHTGGMRVLSGAIVMKNAGAMNAGPMVVRGNAQVKLECGTEPVLLGSLTLGPNALFDLGEGGVTVPAGYYDESALRQALISGRNGGTWDGTKGITSSTAAGVAGGAGTAAATSLAVGYTVNADSSVTIRHTANGDAQLDGKVDFDDILALFPNYGAAGSFTWQGGDFTYDGKVDFDDMLALFPNYGEAGVFGTSASGLGGGGGSSLSLGTGGGSGSGAGTGGGDGSGDSIANTEAVMGPDAPSDLPRGTVQTLRRDDRGTAVDGQASGLDATSLAFAGLVEQGGGAKKKDDTGVGVAAIW